MIRSIASLSLAALAAGAALADPAGHYAEHCAACHGDGRLGGTGPALIPETLGRMRGPDLAAVIAAGRDATQMPGFSDLLAEAEIAALAAWLETPLAAIPPWGAAEIEASRTLDPLYDPADGPVFTADPLNLFVVVETGDHHVSVLDGDRFEVLDRFATPFAVHGGPKFSPDGRFVYVMSRDGWVQKYDLWTLAEVGRVRAGLNSRNIAISHDGRWLAVANYLPETLTLLAAEDLSVARVLDVSALDGTPSRVSAVYQAPERESFILALRDAPEIWEVATGGAVPFALRRIAVDEPIDDFFFTPDYRHLIGASRSGDRGVVVDIDAGAETAELPLPGMPHLGSGISWLRDGRRVMATPHLREARLSVIDTETWEVVDRIETAGPGFFLRSHETSPHVWADAFLGEARDTMHVIDKETLEIVANLTPEPGATAAHVEFDRSGRHALVSIWEEDGAIVVYDAATLAEVKRLPMRKPSGKYNVWNKITFSDGTSH